VIRGARTVAIHSRSMVGTTAEDRGVADAITQPEGVDHPTLRKSRSPGHHPIT
jgi:hypothetical protein